MDAASAISEFDGSPFALTADARIGASWAGRPEILGRVTRLLRSFQSRPDSSIDLIWANFGAGKSHTLYHIEHLLSRTPNAACVFVEIPEQIRHFLDLYRPIVSALPWPRLAPLIAQPGPFKNVDLRRAATVIANGNASERAIALEWTVGGRPNARELRSLTGISSRIESDVLATEILSEIIIAMSANKMRLVILLDEFQRLSVLQERYRAAILSCLRSLYSRNAAHLSVIVAATTRIEKTALEILPNELRTLMGMRPAISLPEMSEDEAFQFVLARFAAFRPADYAGNPWAPLTEEVIRTTLRFIANKTTNQLIPRTVLQALSWIYDEVQLEGAELSSAKVEQLLSDLSWETN